MSGLISDFERIRARSRLDIYHTQVFRPIEEATKFDVFYSSLLNEAEFRTPPMVLLVGPYSVGKTTFIEHGAAFKFKGPSTRGLLACAG